MINSFDRILEAAKKLRESTIMCKKLKELNNLTAEEVLELYGESTVPVDIEKLLKKLGVKYAPMDFTEIEKIIPNQVENWGNILGAVTLLDDDLAIFYREGDTENRRRFTLAHELAHCCLDGENLEDGHIEFRFGNPSEKNKEIAANIFAGKILIPKDKLLEKYRNITLPLADVLAREFQVSVTVMEERLKVLGLSYYSPTYVKGE